MALATAQSARTVARWRLRARAVCQHTRGSNAVAGEWMRGRAADVQARALDERCREQAARGGKWRRCGRGRCVLAVHGAGSGAGAPTRRHHGRTRTRDSMVEHVRAVHRHLHDVLRRENEKWKLARREVILDQAVLGTPNLGIFL